MTISVVTGAAGFVGSALVRRLVAAGDRVRAIVLPGDALAGELSTPVPGDATPVPGDATPVSGDALDAFDAPGAPDALEIVPADVTDYAALAPVFAGASRVFHTAALVHAWAPYERFHAVNVGGTSNVARAVLEHHVPRLVHVSTSDVFGLADGDRVLDERSPFRGWNEPYADTKIAAEERLWKMRREQGLPLTVIYPGWVYGPGDRAFFPGLAEAIAGGIMVFWARDVRLAWTYVENLVDACLAASEEPRALGEGYLAFDTLEGPTLEEVGARIAATIGARAPTRHVPYALTLAVARGLEAACRLAGARTGPPLRSVDVKAFGRQWYFSNAKLRELGWSPRVGVDEGMRRALAFLASQRTRAGFRATT